MRREGQREIKDKSWIWGLSTSMDSEATDRDNKQG